jgi:hypothetical protein
MNIKFKKAIVLGTLLSALLAAVGCEYIPHKVYEVVTVSGETIKLSCPAIDRSRSVFSYIYSGACIVVKD